MKIVFLQNSATQPRCHKRYRTFKQAGIDCVAYSFNRNWYNVNLPKDIQINSLGDLKPGSYFKRLLLYIKKLRPVFKQFKDSFFYCYGQDMAFVAYLFRKKFVYEESDIMYLEYKSAIIRYLMKKLDLLLQKKSVVTVLTSQGFVEYLYKKKPENVFVLPNLLDSAFLSLQRPLPKEFNANIIRFAFIGLIRYERNIASFIEAMIEVNPNHEFHIWGDGGEVQKNFVNRLCEHYQQVYYHGPFRNPLDLPQIYSQTDVNFVCYDTNGLNERIAEPNKLYESTYFNTPILVSSNTFLSSVVKRWDNGFILDCSNKDNIKIFLEELTNEELKNKSLNCNRIPKEKIIDNGYSVKMIIDYIINKK